MAEAVSEVLARFIPNGVAIESTAVSANSDDSEDTPSARCGCMVFYGSTILIANLLE